jgi:hypothetical protein
MDGGMMDWFVVGPFVAMAYHDDAGLCSFARDGI